MQALTRAQQALVGERDSARQAWQEGSHRVKALEAKAGDLASQLQTLQQAHDAAQADLAQARARAAALEHELAEARAQSASHPTAEAMSAMQAERDALSARCTVLQERGAQIDKRLADMETSMQALTKDKQTLTTERDMAQKSLQEKTKRVQVLEGETADLRVRLDLMVQEIVRAESQLDVLKELFVQEATL
jgi:chromosome segregation ATPase